MSLVVASRVASQGLQVGLQAGKTASNISKELYGYDFVGLLIRIVVFQFVALVLAKYIEMVIGVSNIIVKIAQFLGFGIPNFLPQWLVNFYTNGWNGIQYWDVVKGLTIFLLVMELRNYEKSQRGLGFEPQPFTQGIFYLLIGFFLTITIPQIWQRIRDSAALALKPAKV